MPTPKKKPAGKAAAPIRHEPDWAKIDTLTDEEIEAQIAANSDAAPLLTEEWFERADKLEPMDVKAIRGRLGLSQSEFARTFGLNVTVLRDWEQRRHVPRGAALSLLRIIEREPEAARRALAGSAVEIKRSTAPLRGARRPK